MKPQIIMIAASTLCGRISPVGFTSIRDRQILETMRDQTDASLMGAGTLRDADPEMRCSQGRLPENRIRAFVTSSGVIPSIDKKIFKTGPKPFFFFPDDIPEEIKERISDIAIVKAVPRTERGISIKETIRDLYDMGAKRILVEGCGNFNYSCLAEGVIDELFLTIAPFISGDRTAASLADAAMKIPAFIRLELIECSHSNETGEIFTRYKVMK